MIRYVTGRLVQIALVALVASFAVFLLTRALPGDPATLYAGQDASEETIEAVRRSFGLDRPMVVQYWAWLSEAVQGNFGQSYVSRLPAGQLILQALPATLQLALAAVILALLIGLPTGVIAALRPRSRTDYAITTYNGVALGVPSFWLGILLIMFFALVLGILPPGGRVSLFDDPLAALKTLALPAFALAFRLSAVVSRFTRSAVLEAMEQDYISTARAKGVSFRTLLIHHAFRNAMIPLVTVLAVELAGLLNGAIVLEAIFSWPGMGWLALQSVTSRDYLVLQGVLLLFVVGTLLLNLCADVVHAWLDPRVRSRERVAA